MPNLSDLLGPRTAPYVPRYVDFGEAECAWKDYHFNTATCNPSDVRNGLWDQDTVDIAFSCQTYNYRETGDLPQYWENPYEAYSFHYNADENVFEPATELAGGDCPFRNVELKTMISYRAGAEKVQKVVMCRFEASPRRRWEVRLNAENPGVLLGVMYRQGGAIVGQFNVTVNNYGGGNPPAVEDEGDSSTSKAGSRTEEDEKASEVTARGRPAGDTVNPPENAVTYLDPRTPPQDEPADKGTALDADALRREAENRRLEQRCSICLNDFDLEHRKAVQHFCLHKVCAPCKDRMIHFHRQIDPPCPECRRPLRELDPRRIHRRQQEADCHPCTVL